MMIWAKLFSLFGAVASESRAPDEIKLDHSLRNYHTAMFGAAAKAQAITARRESDPKRDELRALKDRSNDTFTRIAREMQGKRER